MSVHEALRTLVTRYGERTLDAADDLRATLDDFLEEGQATPGEINLLVDAVRLGAYHQMNSMLTHGADPQTAVEAAGARLAEDRGGDQRSASWACATLGYAIGRVPEALVLAYRSQPPRGSVGAPPPVTDYGITPPVTDYGITPPQTVAPGPGPQQPTGHPSGVYGFSGTPTATQGPSYGPPASPPQGPGTGAWQAQPAAGGPGSGGKRNLFIGIGAAVAAAAVVAVVAIVATSGDEEGNPQAETTTEPVDPSDDVTTPVDDEEELDSQFAVSELSTSYSALGSEIAAGADSCGRVEPEEGQTELVTCSFSQLDVEFVTYADQAALDAARSTIQDDTASQTYELESSKTADSGHFHMASDPTLDVTWMYWDSTSSLQSAYVTDTPEELPLEAAKAFFDQRRATDATRTFPEPVAPFKAPALWEMAQDYVGDQVKGNKVTGCSKADVYDGDLEAVSCVDGDYTVFFYAKESVDALESERADVSDGSVSDVPWNWFAGKESDYPTSGRLIKKRVEGDAVVYWDDLGLLGTGYIYGPGDKFPPAEAYWESGE